MAWRQEEVTGTKNGSNTTFTIPFTPEVNTVMLFHNGAVVTRTTGTPVAGEFFISGSAITMGTAPYATDRLIIWAKEA